MGSSRMRRGRVAANRKPIAGAKTVKVVVVVPLHYYLLVRNSSARLARGEFQSGLNKEAHP